uniref:(northern house mosquito) hypothetical protein n=1 Tax=Culex pipiens TaxID=7175 RepID=A0A8D8KTU5_CULPI
MQTDLVHFRAKKQHTAHVLAAQQQNQWMLRRFDVKLANISGRTQGGTSPAKIEQQQLHDSVANRREMSRTLGGQQGHKNGQHLGQVQGASVNQLYKGLHGQLGRLWIVRFAEAFEQFDFVGGCH